MQFDPFCQFISLFSSPTLNLPVQLIWCCNTIWNCHKLKSWQEFTFALLLLHRKSAAKSFRRSCFMRLEIIWKCNWYTQKGFIDYGVRETQIEDHGEHGKDIKHGDILQFSNCGVLPFFNHHVLQLRCEMLIASLLKGSQDLYNSLEVTKKIIMQSCRIWFSCRMSTDL